MKRHFAWRPHVDSDPLFNPFIPSERAVRPEHVEIDEEESYGEDVEAAQEESAPEESPSGENVEPAETRAATVSASPETGPFVRALSSVKRLFGRMH